MNQVIVFDVNETLIDVGALGPFYIGMFGESAARREWFGQMLQSAFVSTITGTYRDFGTLGMSALTMVARRRGVELLDEDRTALRDGMRQLPPHPEVREALERLRAAGFRLVTLTNSTLEAGEAQLANAGPGTVSDGGRADGRDGAGDPACGGPRLGYRRGPERRVCGRLRRPARPGAR